MRTSCIFLLSISAKYVMMGSHSLRSSSSTRWQAYTAQRLWKMESLQDRRLDVSKSELRTRADGILCEPIKPSADKQALEEAGKQALEEVCYSHVQHKHTCD